jgi:hypothetical protein
MRDTLCTTGKKKGYPQRASRSYKKIWGDKIPSDEFSIVAGTIVLIYNFMITIVHLLVDKPLGRFFK